MSENEEQQPAIDDRHDDKKGKPWFRSNRGGVGFRPQTWQGVLILVVIVAAIVVIVVLARSGHL
jgi:hypothetical protein